MHLSTSHHACCLFTGMGGDICGSCEHFCSRGLLVRVAPFLPGAALVHIRACRIEFNRMIHEGLHIQHILDCASWLQCMLQLLN